MKNYKIETKLHKKRDGCEWIFKGGQTVCADMPIAKVNGKMYCKHHFEIFKLVDNQFKILELMEETEC